MHGSTLITLNVLIPLWTLICVSDSRRVGSSYHVRTIVSVEWVFLESLPYITHTHKGGVLFFSSVYI